MKHSILFTGHMIDAPQRKQPRFPAYKEQGVQQALEKYLRAEMKNTTNELTGMAGGACGGDILFHELCIDLKISSEIYLALPIEEFKKASVSFAGLEWVGRFERLIKKRPVHILPPAIGDEKNNVWERANIWMLNSALKNGGENMTLLALWDGKTGDGGGGTEHMINVAREQKASVKIIEIGKING